MKAQYREGEGFMIFIPPTESNLAVAILQLIVNELEERGESTREFEKLINAVERDRRVVQ